MLKCQLNQHVLSSAASRVERNWNTRGRNWEGERGGGGQEETEEELLIQSGRRRITFVFRVDRPASLREGSVMYTFSWPQSQDSRSSSLVFSSVAVKIPLGLLLCYILSTYNWWQLNLNKIKLYFVLWFNFCVCCLVQLQTFSPQAFKCKTNKRAIQIHFDLIWNNVSNT